MISEEIVNNIITKKPSEEVPYSDKYDTIPLSQKFFTLIKNREESVIVHAVDGGSVVLFDGGGWIISKVKVGRVKYNGVNKAEQEVKEYYVLVINKEKYEVIIFDKEENEISVELPDFNNLEIDEIPAKVMKLLEWLYCEELCKECNDLILMDSALEPENKVEELVIKRLSSVNNSIVGFCKTSRLRTTSGRSLLGVINVLSPESSAWFYHPLYENEGLIKTFIVKLKKNSDYCHKVQLFNKDEPRKVFPILNTLAGDSETLGYPYPLFKVDKIARVNSFEKRDELINFIKVLKRTDLMFDTRSQSFHSILDNRMYK